MKTIIFIILLITISFDSFSQSEKIKQQAEYYAKASESRDYVSIVKLTYTPFINMVGGKDKAISLLKVTMEDLASKGTSIESIIINEPQKVYHAGTELHSLVPMKVLTKVPGGKEVLKTYLLAVSADNGNNWTFLNLTGGGLNNKTITTLIPNFNQELIIPGISPAEFTKD